MRYSPRRYASTGTQVNCRSIYKFSHHVLVTHCYACHKTLVNTQPVAVAQVHSRPDRMSLSVSLVGVRLTAQPLVMVPLSEDVSPAIFEN